MQSFTKPTSKQIEETLPLLSSPQHELHFFSNLQNPHWVVPLASQDVFKYPPKAETVKGGGTRFPSWPQANYLARMSALTPGIVAEILEKIETDNTSVIGNIIQAALAMPASVAKRLVSLISKASRTGVLRFYYEDACKFCVFLGENGEVDTAEILANALFEPQFEKGQENPKHLDDYWFKEGLKLPIMVKNKPEAYLRKLCQWLKNSIDAIRTIEGENDYSWSWRPAIEESEQNRDYEFPGVMTGFVRMGFETALRLEKPMAFNDALEILKNEEYLVFRRIQIHLINEFVDKCPELAQTTMLDFNLSEDRYFKHEYAMLVANNFNSLNEDEKVMWYAWVDKGPDMESFNQSVKDNTGKEATDEDRKGRTEYWQFEKLYLIREHLKGERKGFYENILAKKGEPEFADKNFSMTTSWGNDSPITVALFNSRSP